MNNERDIQFRGKSCTNLHQSQLTSYCARVVGILCTCQKDEQRYPNLNFCGSSQVLFGALVKFATTQFLSGYNMCTNSTKEKQRTIFLPLGKSASWLIEILYQSSSSWMPKNFSNCDCGVRTVLPETNPCLNDWGSERLSEFFFPQWHLGGDPELIFLAVLCEVACTSFFVPYPVTVVQFCNLFFVVEPVLGCSFRGSDTRISGIILLWVLSEFVFVVHIVFFPLLSYFVFVKLIVELVLVGYCFFVCLVVLLVVVSLCGNGVCVTDPITRPQTRSPSNKHTFLWGSTWSEKFSRG